MEDRLKELVDKLRGALGDRLISVILYGSAAGDDHHGKFSDLNILCVLSKIAPRELSEVEPVARWWRELNNPSPLLMTAEEVKSSADSFPVEFHDMIERRRVLWGVDSIAGLTVDRSFYRAQVEHELRAKLFRLRQKAAGVLGDGRALGKLMLDSISTFCVLARHAMLLSGMEVSPRKREVAGALRQIGVDPAPFEALLDVREGKREESAMDARTLFAGYLTQIEALVQHVDQMGAS